MQLNNLADVSIQGRWVTHTLQVLKPGKKGLMTQVCCLINNLFVCMHNIYLIMIVWSI